MKRTRKFNYWLIFSLLSTSFALQTSCNINIVSNHNIKVRDLNVINIREHSASIVITLNESINIKKASLKYNDGLESHILNKFEHEQNKIIFDLSTLPANTQISLESLKIDNVELNIASFNKSFKTKQIIEEKLPPKIDESSKQNGNKDVINDASNEQKDDNFAISSIEYTDFLPYSVNIKLTFSSYELSDINKKDFLIKYRDNAGSKFEKTIENYETNSPDLNFKLSNLKSNHTYVIEQIYLNNKELNIENYSKTFTTAKEDNVLKITNFEYKNIFSTQHNVNMNFEIANLSLDESKKYDVIVKSVDKASNKEFFVNNGHKITSRPNTKLINIKADILDEDDEENDYGNSVDNFSEGFLANKTYEVKSLIFQEIQSKNTISIDLPKWINAIIDTHNNSTQFNNLKLEKINDKLQVSLSLNEQNNEKNSVKVHLKSTKGWFSTINLEYNKTLHKWVGYLNNFIDNDRYFIDNVLLNNTTIYASDNNENNFIDLVSKTKNEIEIKRTSHEKINNNASIKIKIALDKSEKSDFVVKYQEPKLIIKNDDDASLITLDLINKNLDTNEIEYIFNIPQFSNSYSIKSLLFNNFSIDKNYQIYSKMSTTGKILSEYELNKLTSSFTDITLNKKYWALNIIEKIKNINDLLFISNLDLKNYNLDEYDVELSDIKWSNIDELNGDLTLSFKLKSGSNFSTTKSVKINNLYSKQWIIDNKNNLKYFANFIKISEKGKTKSTKDFDEAFSGREYISNDLDASLGGKSSSIIDINDLKLSDFIDIDESLINTKNSKFKILIAKFHDKEQAIGNPKTTPYAALGYMQYKLLFWFDTTNLDNKHANEIKHLWLGGYNNYNNKNSKDLFDLLNKSLPHEYNNNFLSFNSEFGIKKDLKLSIEQIIDQVKNINDDAKKWEKLLSLSNMNKFIDRLVNITQNDYEPPIMDEYWKFNIYSISKEILGDNKFIVIKMYIKPSYTLNSSEQKDTVVNGNYITFKLLVN